MAADADIGQARAFARFSGVERPSRAGRLARVITPALLFAVAGLGISLWRDVAFWRDAFLLLTGVLVAVAALLRIGQGASTGLTRAGRLSKRMRPWISMLDGDPAPGLISCADGEVLYHNASARSELSAATGATVAAVLRAWLTDPAAVILRLSTKARTARAASEDLVTRQGHVRVTVRSTDADLMVWRVELFGQKQAAPEGAASISLPMLTVSKSGTILFMNDALRRLVGKRVRGLDRLFLDLPVTAGGTARLVTAEGPVDVLVIEGAETPGRRELYLAPGLAGAGNKADADAIDALPIALMKLNARGIILGSNARARKFLGLDQDDGARFSDLVVGLGRPVGEWVAMLAEGKGLRRPEVVRVRNSEREVYIQVTPERVEENGEEIVLAVLSDVTDLKTLEARVVQAQKMQAIGQLAGGVAHDFNNLLTAITGHCDLLLLRHDKGDSDFADLQQINQNANRAASLVSQLLAFSRKQTLRPERVDLRDALADLTHLLNRLLGEKVSLSLSHDPDLRPTRADKRQLEQVIMNLVVNARDAMPDDGGEVRIGTSNVYFEEDVQRERATIPAGDYVLIRVSDNGCGIPRDKLAAIFEPFFTTKKTREGTGLGLSTAYGIVKQTGGFIFVESVVGAGTEFSIFLPAADPALCAIPAAGPASEGPATPSGRCEGVILLVEDEAPVRAFASRALRLKGFTVLEAENAEQALAILNDPDLDVDLFLTDVIMPGKDGPTWVREALAARPDTKVVFVSGYAEEPVSESRARVPNSAFLPKPFSLSDLVETVQLQLS